MEKGERYSEPARGEAESVGQPEKNELDNDELWEFVREEARELGLPEEEYVAQSRQVLAHLLEKHPGLRDEMKRHEEALLAALRPASEPRPGE